MPLGATERAAWAAVLAARRGGKTLPAALQTALVDFFAANDLSLSEYWPVDVKDVDWEKEWQEFAAAAGVGADWQKGQILRWIENKQGASAPANHRADAIVKLIEQGGVTLPTGLITQIEAAMSTSAAGSSSG